MRSSCRPDLKEIIENHTLDLIATRRSSCSVLSFCGSPELSQKLHHFKISNDMLAVMTGNRKHQMEYVSESYGGVKTPKKPQPQKRVEHPLVGTNIFVKGLDTTADQGEIPFGERNSWDTHLTASMDDILEGVL